MTKPDHRKYALHAPRRTDVGFEAAHLRELAYFDAKFHMGTSRNRAPTVRQHHWIDQNDSQLLPVSRRIK